MANKFATKALTAAGIGATIKSFLDLKSPQPGNSRMNQFAALVKQRSIAQTNRFLVTLPLPQLGQFSNNVQPEMLQLLCSSATLPGVSLNTVPFRPYGTGMFENIVTGAAVAPVTLNFYCDATGVIQNFFYEWIDRIYGFSTKPQFGILDRYPNTVEYRESYEVQMLVTVYNEVEDKVVVCQLIEAFPASIGEIQFSWSNTNEICILPVTFNYTTWSYETPENIGKPSSDKRQLSLFEKAIKAATAVQVIKSLKKPQNLQDVLSVTNNAKILINNFK